MRRAPRVLLSAAIGAAVLPLLPLSAGLGTGVAGAAAPCGPTAGTGQAPWPEFDGSPLHSGDGAGVPQAAGTLRPAWKSPLLDGAVYAQPLVAGGCLYVTTEADSVYALDLATGAVRWHAHLATPVTNGLPCGDIGPSGITGAPVLDPATGELFVVALTYFSGRPGHELFGLRSSNGQVLLRQRFGLPGTDPAAQQQRAALELEKGHVYIALGGLYGDCGHYLGAVVSVPEKGGSPGYWHVPTANEAGIWEPGGPALLPDGNLLVADGNGAGSKGQHFDGSNAVFELTANLKVAGVFAPVDWAGLNGSDSDLGSTGPAIVPGGLALQVGKSGTGYLVDVAHLGGVGGQVAKGTVCQGAYGADAVAGNVVYLPCDNGLTAVQVTARSFRVLWTSDDGGRGCPVVAGGRVFEQSSSGTVQAVDASTGKEAQSLDLTSPETHFPWLVAVGGDLYAASGRKIVALSGL